MTCPICGSQIPQDMDMGLVSGAIPDPHPMGPKVFVFRSLSLKACMLCSVLLFDTDVTFDATDWDTQGESHAG